MKHLKRTRMKICFLSLALTVSTLSLYAQSIDWVDVHNKTVRGIDLLYSVELDAASRTFDSVRQEAPGDPRGYFFGSMVDFWRYNLTGSKQEYERFIDGSDRVIDVCEKLLDQNPRDAKSRFFLGGILGYRGMAHQTNGSIMKAVKEGKVGYEYLGDAVRLDSTLYDAKLGFGLFTYLLAKVPPSLRWIVNLLGFSGNAENGLNMLKEAAAHGVYTRSEASLYLAQFMFNERRYDDAFAYLTPLLKKYPDNALFQVLAASWNLRLDKPDEALVAAKKAAESNKKKQLRYAEEVVYSTLGGIYYSRNDFVNAAENYGLYFEKNPVPGRITNWLYYRAGVSHEMIGQRTKALEVYGRMRKSDDKDRPAEPYYYRRGQELLGKPMGEGEKLLICTGNLANRMPIDSARALYQRALVLVKGDPDLELRVLYALQQLCYDKEQYEQALDVTAQILALTPKREVWIVPHALFRQGQTLARLGRKGEARQAFDRAAEYDDYDYQTSLEGRLEQEKKRLEGQ
jgi:tetratricopeptide (TPR) repeat protein